MFTSTEPYRDVKNASASLLSFRAVADVFELRPRWLCALLFLTSWNSTFLELHFLLNETLLSIIHRPKLRACCYNQHIPTFNLTVPPPLPRTPSLQEDHVPISRYSHGPTRPRRPEAKNHHFDSRCCQQAHTLPHRSTPREPDHVEAPTRCPST